MSSSPSLVKAVQQAMQRIAPLRLAESWDNVGLLLEAPFEKSRQRHRVMLTIDLTTPVMHETLAHEASVLIAYHPPLFAPTRSLTLANPLHASLLRLAAEGVSVYSPHTALDAVWGGVNDWLAEGVLGRTHTASGASPNASSTALAASSPPLAGDIGPLAGEKKLTVQGESEGADGRLVVLEDPVHIDEIVKRVKSCLGLTMLQVAYPTNQSTAHPSPTPTIRTVAICAGSGGDMLAGKEADVLLTGEMGHHDVLAAIAAGKHVILCGHTNTERGYLPVLAARLAAELNGAGVVSTLGPVEVVVSQRDAHPLQFV
ncbi:GTP cyclohydrolase 1 type 2/Nif3 [Schizophyllum amplum]|uniref:GTP cyclohydrolase 1 type 2/Nif3 n=1 Tax=Schizophyllum amplum TaxID=97359 RepID=A0A550C8T0_9AGAR|nr:GTP cyclohydrolase 1 type 2/Nif3 [Auriculariopsis ampla]